MKVSLKIGDRIPIATGSFQSGVGTVGGAPYAQTQFQFTDVGIKVEITPQVHSADEVTLHVAFEVSTVRSYTNIGGVQQPIIGQRTNEADIRLREGEINILAGLDGMQDSSVVNGIPGLVNIPILGKVFFGSEPYRKGPPATDDRADARTSCALRTIRPRICAACTRDRISRCG